MSKITVTELQGHTSGGDANKVKIKTGHTLAVQSNATVGGTLTTTGALDVTTSTHANASVFKSTGNTQIMLQDTDASANDQFWGLQNSGGEFNILTCNDDRASGFVTPMTITQAGLVKKPLTPSFQVNASPSKDSNGKIYSFGTIQHNVGSHYNNGLGRFTAPTAGLYHFYASIWPSGTMDANNTYLSFIKNGAEMFGAHSATDRVSMTIIGSFVLSVNDYIELDIQGGWDIQGSTPRNNFGGHFVG